MTNGHIRSLWRHPLCWVGGALAFLSFFSVLSMLLVEALLGTSNPYVGVFTYIVYPAFLVLGLLLIPVGALLERRRRVRGGELPPHPRIDLNNPRTRALFVFVAVSTVFILGLISTVGYRAHQFTDSNGFCGELCHSVMEPEFTAYQASPHARVLCVDCHVGTGATWFVRSKLSGAYQVYSVLFNKYPRPIDSPVENLRPAQETCEQCHWPEKFFGAQLRVTTRYGYDEKNSVRQIRMLVHTGGGSPTTGLTTGIHWHMNIANEMWYRAADPQRQKIPWVRLKDMQGEVTEYFDQGVPLPPEELEQMELRKTDCIDCHNRPSHIFRDPDAATDNALLAGLIDSDIPYIKREAVRNLTRPYPNAKQARESIATSLNRFYLSQYPQLYDAKNEAIRKAVSEVQRIYQTNFFPEMKVDWRTHPDNIGHTLYPGCFRCHDGKHVSREGKVIRNECKLCHTIIGQGAQVAATTEVDMPEMFEHPWPMKGRHAELNCNECHWRGRGMETDCTTCHARPAKAPMAFPCGQCHLKEQSVKPILACATCHAKRSELHLRPAHSMVECTTCHVPHQWGVAQRKSCLGCHQDKTAHNPEGTCQACHQFRKLAQSSQPDRIEFSDLRGGAGFFLYLRRALHSSPGPFPSQMG